jgi:hypothetical protein
MGRRDTIISLQVAAAPADAIVDFQAVIGVPDSRRSTGEQWPGQSRSRDFAELGASARS